MASQRLHERGYHEAERFNGTPDSQTPLDSSSVLPPWQMGEGKNPTPGLDLCGTGPGMGRQVPNGFGKPRGRRLRERSEP